MTDWLDENPFCLIIQSETGDVGIDLGESGWAQTYAKSIRWAPAIWNLVLKEKMAAVLRVAIHDGEQGYYTARHIGAAGSGGGNEVIAYGIGKKLTSGEVLRLWALPDGTICGGEDVDIFGALLLEQIGPRSAPTE